VSVLQFALLTIAALAPKDCSYDESKLVDMPYEAFDQDMTGGWRRLENRGCVSAAANLIRAYRHKNFDLPSSEQTILSWHEGQLRAIAGDYDAAIPLLLRGVPENDTAIDFVDYALGTVAFLQHDKQALITARSRLASLPKPAGFAGTVASTKDGKTVQIPVDWPPNLNVLDGLIRCFGKPYKVAYNCRA